MMASLLRQRRNLSSASGGEIDENDGRISEGERRRAEQDETMFVKKQHEEEHKDVKMSASHSGSQQAVDQTSRTDEIAIATVIPPLSYKITKWVMIRSVGAIYFVAFLGAWNQNLGLMGRHGLMPAEDHWRTVQAQFNSKWNGFLKHPSLFWWIPMSDFSLRGIYGMGLAISFLVVFGGINSWLLQLILWILYFSVVTSAEETTFYSYGWESQVLETGFLTIFLCGLPYVSRNRLKLCLMESSAVHSQKQLAPSYIILWLFRWLCFRISMGAGLIKIRGSSCWTDKTCLYYHFETQPIPSPLSYVYHFLPRSIQRTMVDVDLIVQLYTSFFVLMPTLVFFSPKLTKLSRLFVRVGGFVQAGFMVGIMLSGNFAFLNHLTIIPAFSCLDDDCWPAIPFAMAKSKEDMPTQSEKRHFRLRYLFDATLLLYIGYLSSPVISNLLQVGGSRQVMNASFDPLRLVNTYGAFGSVGRLRYEPIVMISDDGQDWVELEFPCKPGNLTRRPCFCAPYHYRVDWNIWFLGFKPHEMYLRKREFWLYHLLRKILDSAHDRPRPWLSLLDRSTAEMLNSKYYHQSRAPRFAKVEMFHYRMSGPLQELLYDEWKTGSAEWWNRQFEETLIHPVIVANGKLGWADID